MKHLFTFIFVSSLLLVVAIGAGQAPANLRLSVVSAMRPMSPAGSPFDSFVHVLPALVDL